MNKGLIRLFAVAIFLTVAGFASAQNVDNKIIGFETGVVYGYQVSNDNIGNGINFAINVTLTDNLSVGYGLITNYSNLFSAQMLMFNYGLSDKLGATVSYSGSGYIGMGFFYNLFERKDVILSNLKLRVDYDFYYDSIASGFLLTTLSLGIGI
jgi:hypothetical protein